MRLTTLLICLLALGSSAFGQVPALPNEPSPHLRQRPQLSLSGIWTGELLQNEGGIADRFDFTMDLRQNGIFLQGTAHVKLGDIWAEMELSGYQQANGSWKLTETKILRDNKPETLSWCMKLYELRVGYTGEGMTLHGPWWGTSGFGPCVPGSVRLRMKKKSA